MCYQRHNSFCLDNSNEYIIITNNQNGTELITLNMSLVSVRIIAFWYQLHLMSHISMSPRGDGSSSRSGIFTKTNCYIL